MLELLNFEEAAQSTNNNGWVSIVLIAVTIVAFVLMLVIPNRKQKKASGRNDVETCRW